MDIDITDRQLQIVSDPERIKIMLDDTRMKILRIMNKGIIRKDNIIDDAFSVKELAIKMDVTPQGLYHHIDKLVEYGFLEVARQVQKKRSIISYYKRTCRNFVVSYGSDEAMETVNTYNKEFMESLVDIFALKLSPEEHMRINDLLGIIFKEESQLMDRLFAKVAQEFKNDENLYPFVKYMQILIMMTTPHVNKYYQEIVGILTKDLDY